jgi:magnesium-transporting ATPase (P-type)
MLLLVSGGFFWAGVTFWLADIVRFEWVALACSSALFNGWVPVLQARLQFWRFGLVAMVNAFTIMGVILVVVSADPTVTNTIFAYALGNFLGFGVGWTICGLPRPGGVDFSQARNIMEIGTTLTLSSFAESGLFLGIRYVIFLFGSYEFLGIFSFAVDLAQRSVGVVINITAFAVVPKAYQGSASDETGNFFNILKRGGFVAISLSGLAFATILVIKKFGWFDILSNGQFLLPVFTAVSVAIIVNRLKKMILDPIAVENKVVLALPVGYIFVMPVALALATWCARHGFEMVIAYIYALAYFSAACFSAVIIWFRSRKATCYRNR